MNTFSSDNVNSILVNEQNIKNKLNLRISEKHSRNIYKRDTSRSQYNSQINTESNTKGKKTKKIQVMTNEQRDLLKKLLKENVKENQKRIADNLVDIFVESKRVSKDQIKHKIKKKQCGTPKSKFHKEVQKVSNPKLKRYGSVININLKNHSKFKKIKNRKIIENKDVEKYSNINNTEDTLPDNKKLDKF